MEKGTTIAVASALVHLCSLVFLWQAVWKDESTCAMHDVAIDWAWGVIGFTVAEIVLSYWSFMDKEAAAPKTGFYLFKIALFVLSNIIGTAAVAVTWAIVHYMCSADPAYWLVATFIIRVLEPALGHYMALEKI